MEKKNYQKKITIPVEIDSAISQMTRLSNEVIEQMLTYGAVQIKLQAKGSWKRVRAKSHILNVNDLIKVVYDKKILNLRPYEDYHAVYEDKHWGVFYKPSGIMSQGTDAGDHVSMMYPFVKRKKEAFVLHRLDRETAGLMIYAFTKEGARRFSLLFSQNKVEKTYWAIVVGERSKISLMSDFIINQPLDGKICSTIITYIKSITNDYHLIEVKTIQGRFHQIRRHLLEIGAPVLGDPLYGKNNKNQNGLKLACVSLNFQDPFQQKIVSFFREPVDWSL